MPEMWNVYPRKLQTVNRDSPSEGYASKVTGTRLSKTFEIHIILSCAPDARHKVTELNVFSDRCWSIFGSILPLFASASPV
jgi:hypothetical protein